MIMPNAKTHQLILATAMLTAFGPALAQEPVNINVPPKSENIVLPAPTPAPVPQPEIVFEESLIETTPDIRGLLVSRHEGMMNSLMTAPVKTVHVAVGDRVKKNQLLVSFDCSTLDARLRSAKARLKQHQILFDANKELALENAVTQLDLLMAEAKLEEGTADVQNVWAQLERCEIKAPYDGVITDIVADERESVQIGDALIGIVDDRNLDMIVHVPSVWIKNNLIGKRFKVQIDETGKEYHATVKRVTPKIDSSSGTVEVTATVKGSHEELLPGMSGAADFPDAQ